MPTCLKTLRKRPVFTSKITMDGCRASPDWGRGEIPRPTPRELEVAHARRGENYLGRNRRTACAPRTSPPPTRARSADSRAHSRLSDRVVLIWGGVRSRQVRITTAAISVTTSARELRRCVTPPHFGNFRLRAAGNYTAASMNDSFTDKFNDG